MSNPKMNPKLGVIYLIMSPWSSKNQNENFAQICHHTINISFIFTTPWVHDPSPSHINSKKNLHGSMKATFTVERIETTVEIKGGFIVRVVAAAVSRKQRNSCTGGRVEVYITYATCMAQNCPIWCLSKCIKPKSFMSNPTVDHQ